LEEESIEEEGWAEEDSWRTHLAGSLVVEVVEVKGSVFLQRVQVSA
jgi:hypothetical protein